MKNLFVALCVALLLSACAPTMRADVTQFTTMVAPPAGKNFAVVAEPAQSGSLEFQYYAGLVGGALQDHGFVAAPVGANPDMVVVIHYGSAGNHTEIYGDGPWGCCGWGAGWGAGWGGSGWGWRHGGYGPDIESHTFYSEQLEVQIFDGPAWRNNVHTMLYQGRATGDASVNEISAAVPALVKALFAHFPGNSGRTERITVPITAENEQNLTVRAPPPGGAKTAG